MAEKECAKEVETDMKRAFCYAGYMAYRCRAEQLDLRICPGMERLIDGNQ